MRNTDGMIVSGYIMPCNLVINITWFSWFTHGCE